MTKVQDDLYEAVNGEWAKTATIPDDKPTTGGFADLADDVEKKLMGDFDAVAKGEKSAPDQYFAEAVKLYQKAADFKARDAAGIKPVLNRLVNLNQVDSMAGFNAKAAQLDLDLYPLPFSAGVEPDMKNTAQNVFTVSGPSTILPDTTYYADDNPQGPQLMLMV